MMSRRAVAMMSRLKALIAASILLALGWVGFSSAQQVVVPPPAATAAIPHQYLTGYPVAGGSFTAAQPSIADLATIAGGTLLGNSAAGAATPSALTNPVLGVPGSAGGSLGLAGASGGTVSVLPQTGTATYNFNLPAAAGTAGQPLLSGGGGSTPMSFGTLGVGAGGTGQTSLTSNAFLTGNGSTGINQVALTGLVKGNGGSAPTAAVSGTDYAPATSGSSLLKGSGSGGFTAYGGVSSVSHQWISALSAAGAATQTQPDVGDVTATVTTTATNGGTTMPGGLVLKWCSATVAANGSSSCTFGTQFPTGCITALASSNTGGNTSGFSAPQAACTQTAMTLYNNYASSSQTIVGWAIGH